MKPGLQLRTAQGLTLTPQLQQSIRLLQLSTHELQQELQQALTENPFLELAEESEAESETESESPHTEDDAFPSGDAEFLQRDAASVLADAAGPALAEADDATMWQHGQDSGSDAADGAAPTVEASTDDWEFDGTYAQSGPAADSGHDDWQDRLPADTSLTDHLELQARALRLQPREQAAMQCLIDSLDERGWLADSLEEIADSLLHQLGSTGPEAVEQREELQHLLTMALHLMQAMDPAGVGARDLAECLRLQLRQDAGWAAHPSAGIALALLDQPLELLARRDVRTLTRLTGHSADAVKAALQLMGRLEPQPARRFIHAEREVIVPDVLVRSVPTRAGVIWQVQLYAHALPRLQVQERYAMLLRQHRDAGGTEPLQQQLNEARWLVRSLQQRQETLLRVSEAIVQRQARFFAEGPRAMQPLVMREIADTLGLHESTISRVSSGKYLATPWGTFELKHFFGSGLASEDGTATSSTAVRTLIAQWIAEEPPRKPLSDNRLGEMLQAQGIQCARRTVAKYREQLRIPPAHLRKSLA